MSKYLKVNWTSGPTLVPIKDTFLAAIASLQQQITDITAVQIRNKSEVIESTEANVQTVATNYIQTNYSRAPQNWDGLIITITDKNNDKILYIYSEASNLWINSGINDVDLSNYYTKDKVYNKDEIDTNFQPKLVSGTNIKTINNQSILGSGNITIEGGNSNISNDTATASLKQLQDTSYSSIAIKTKNPNAYNLDNTLTDTETIGALGNYSTSFGGNTQAKGKRAFAIGSSNIAKGNYSFASGTDSVALGNASHVEGYMNTTGPDATLAHAEGGENIVTATRGHAEGYKNIVNKDNSHAEGFNNTVNSINTHAEGSTNETSGDNSHAEGAGNKVLASISSSDTPGSDSSGSTPSGDDWSADDHLGANSHAEGSQNLVYGYSAHAEGANNKVKGHYSHAEGVHNTVDADVAHAEGSTNEVSGINAHAEGESTVASGEAAHSEGKDTTASGAYSHSQGRSTEASGESSHAEGYNTKATGIASHAAGANTTAIGAASYAGGGNTTAKYQNQTVVGQYNDNKAYTLFEVGNGQSGRKSNAFEVFLGGYAEVSTQGGTAKSVVQKQYVDNLVGNINTILATIVEVSE